MAAKKVRIGDSTAVAVTEGMTGVAVETVIEEVEVTRAVETVVEDRVEGDNTIGWQPSRRLAYGLARIIK